MCKGKGAFYSRQERLPLYDSSLPQQGKMLEERD
jgi:hypothetical protein